MSKPLERYQELGVKESLPRIQRYPFACKTLSLILRRAYKEFPKNLQSLIFQDTVTAFRLLPEMQTRNAVLAAHLLLQSVEATLPKQKKNLAVTEYKKAIVAHKRRTKARQEEKGSTQLPQDVLVHIFSFLDMQSLASVGLVCWCWNLAASEDHLWQTHYTNFFGNSSNDLEIKGQQIIRLVEDEGNTLFWREAFKRAYIGNSLEKFKSGRGYCYCSASCQLSNSKSSILTIAKSAWISGNSLEKFKSGRGYCRYCNTIVWLDNMKCSNEHSGLNSENHQVKPESPSQVIEYLLGDLPLKKLHLLDEFSPSSADSDSDSDEGSNSRLWAYPSPLRRSQENPFVINV